MHIEKLTQSVNMLRNQIQNPPSKTLQDFSDLENTFIIKKINSEIELLQQKISNSFKVQKENLDVQLESAPLITNLQRELKDLNIKFLNLSSAPKLQSNEQSNSSGEIKRLRSDLSDQQTKMSNIFSQIKDNLNDRTLIKVRIDKVHEDLGEQLDVIQILQREINSLNSIVGQSDKFKV